MFIDKESSKVLEMKDVSGNHKLTLEKEEEKVKTTNAVLMATRDNNVLPKPDTLCSWKPATICSQN